MSQSTDEETTSQLDMATPPSVQALAAAREEAAIWQARAGYLQNQAEQSAQALGALQQQAQERDEQLRALQGHAAGIEVRLAQAQAALEAAQSATPARPHYAAAVPPPAILSVVDELPRSDTAANQYQRRPLSQIRQIVIHHSGSDEPDQAPHSLAALHVGDARYAWPGIGFHFFIAADGAIYQTNRLETICYHVANLNAHAVGVVLVGRFSANQPTPAQTSATAALLAWLTQELTLPASSIAGHCDVGEETECPGAAWPAWKVTLLQAMARHAQTPRKQLYHYVLFWQSDTAWAEADWQAATRYIARFRPTTGFAPNEAVHAENVTIIGGAGGVSAEVEAALLAAGCRVQRIAGRSIAQTRTILDTMAREGTRFLAASN